MMQLLIKIFSLGVVDKIVVEEWSSITNQLFDTAVLSLKFNVQPEKKQK